MKRQWKIHREVQEYPNGRSRWDRAFLLVLEIARSVEATQTQMSLEVQYASSDLCEGLDSAPSPSPNDRTAIGTVGDLCQPTGMGVGEGEHLS